METQEKVQHIRKACEEANDSIAICTSHFCRKMMCNEVSHQREIRLADILLAIGDYDDKLMKCHKTQDGVLISKELSEVLFLWDFKNDSLSYHAEHKPEVIDFIYSILS